MMPSAIAWCANCDGQKGLAALTEFHQRLQQSTDKASALRQAMLKTMEKHPDPKNWAAFTLIGESN